MGSAPPHCSVVPWPLGVCRAPRLHQDVEVRRPSNGRWANAGLMYPKGGTFAKTKPLAPRFCFLVFVGLNRLGTDEDQSRSASRRSHISRRCRMRVIPHVHAIYHPSTSTRYLVTRHQWFFTKVARHPLIKAGAGVCRQLSSEHPTSSSVCIGWATRNSSSPSRASPMQRSLPTALIGYLRPVRDFSCPR